MKFEKKLLLLPLLGLFAITSCSNNNSSIITNGNTEPERSNIESTGIIMPTGTGSMSDTTKLTSALEYLNHSNKLSITGNNIYKSDTIHNSSFELSKNNDLVHYDFVDDEYVMFKYENDYYKYDYSTLNKLSSNPFENINILDIIYPNLSNSLAYTNALFDANSNSYIIPVVTYNTDARIIFKLNSNDRITSIKFSYNENDNGPSFSSLVHIEDAELSISYDSSYTFDFESLFDNTIDLIPDLLTEFDSSNLKLSNTDKTIYLNSNNDSYFIDGGNAIIENEDGRYLVGDTTLKISDANSLSYLVTLLTNEVVDLSDLSNTNKYVEDNNSYSVTMGNIKISLTITNDELSSIAINNEVFTIEEGEKVNTNTSYSYGLEYELVGDSYYVSGVDSLMGDSIYIPATYNNKKVVGVNENAFKNTKYKTLYVSNGIKELRSFSNMNLESIRIPDSIIYIDGEFNLYSCTKDDGCYYLGNEDNQFLLLYDGNISDSSFSINENTKIINKIEGSGTSLTLPNSVEKLLDKSLFYIENLTNLTLSDNLNYVGDYFINFDSNTISKTEVEIDEYNSLYYIKSNTNNNFLLVSATPDLDLLNNKLVISDNTKFIGRKAFQNALIVEMEIELNDELLYIDDLAFVGANFKSDFILEIKDNVKYVGSKVFDQSNIEGTIISKDTYFESDFLGTVNNEINIYFKGTSEEFDLEVEDRNNINILYYSETELGSNYWHFDNNGKVVINNFS